MRWSGRNCWSSRLDLVSLALIPPVRLHLKSVFVTDTKVFKEGVELLPCDLKGMNEWIQGVRPTSSLRVLG
jgi:hypothetical protein